MYVTLERNGVHTVCVFSRCNKYKLIYRHQSHPLIYLAPLAGFLRLLKLKD